MEVLLMIKGYKNRIMELWRIGRFQAYMVYCSTTDPKDRDSIFDFYALPGDPDKEELRKNDEQQLIELYALGKTYLKN